MRTARSIGLLYLVTMLPAPVNLVYLPSRFLVPGDASATAQRIASSEMVYRLCTLAGFFNNIMFIVLGLSLYRLFKDTDGRQARLMVAFVLASSVIAIVTLVIELAPLVLLHGDKVLAAFNQPQIDGLIYSLLRVRGTALGLVSAFSGLWLLPFGVLVLKSGFMPRAIGWLLILGCFGYLLQSLVSILWPSQVHWLFTATIPIVGPGEIAAIVWLLARGNRVQLADSRLAFA